MFGWQEAAFVPEQGDQGAGEVLCYQEALLCLQVGRLVGGAVLSGSSSMSPGREVGGLGRCCVIRKLFYVSR